MKTHCQATIRRCAVIALGAILTGLLGFHLPPALAGPGTYTRKAVMPMTLLGAASCEANGILYVAGGATNAMASTQLQTLFAYDPKTDSWTQKKDMPTARMLAAASAVNGIVHVIGGGKVLDRTVSPVAEAYDPGSDTWTARTPMPTARFDQTACVLDGLIYVIGGYAAGTTPLSTVECYDPKTDQ
jgi:N-acetylneuraminic acid mutarotase